jgi:hypothetical protein
METLNGYTIVGEWYVTPRERVIAGYRNVDRNGEHFTVWVTARCLPRDENPREWHWGHYFDLTESAINKRDAMADFAARSDIALAVRK